MEKSNMLATNVVLTSKRFHASAFDRYSGGGNNRNPAKLGCWVVGDNTGWGTPSMLPQPCSSNALCLGQGLCALETLQNSQFSTYDVHFSYK